MKSSGPDEHSLGGESLIDFTVLTAWLKPRPFKTTT
jgi:hypothetical protein